MDVGRTAYAVIGVVVAILLIAMFAIPVIEQASMDREVLSNEYTGLTYEMADSFTISYDSDATAFTIDGETITKPSTDAPLLVADTGILNVNSSGNIMFRYYLDGAITSQNLTGSFTATFSDGNISITDTVGTYSVDTTPEIVGLSPSGDLLLNKRGEISVMANNSSDIVLYNVTSSGYQYGSGTVRDSTINYGGDQYYPVVVESTDEGNGSLNIGAATFTVGDSVFTVNYFVPIEYSVMVEGSGTTFTLLSIVPLLLIVGVLMMAVRLIGGRD